MEFRFCLPFFPFFIHCSSLLLFVCLFVFQLLFLFVMDVHWDVDFFVSVFPFIESKLFSNASRMHPIC